MSRFNTSFRVKIYDLPLNRFVNVALPQYLQQLQQHEDNLCKHKSNRDWDRVRTEKLKAQQVASQFEAALEELEEVGRQLTPEDALEFEKKIRPYKNQALDAVRVFKQNSDDSYEVYQTHIPENDQKQQVMLLEEKILPEEIEIEQRKVQLETYVNLQKDVEELQNLFSEFAHQVHTQETMVTNIENNVEVALEDVKEGQQNLAKAARFKTALYPITGALIGTCIGGPVGLLAGLKIGGLAALGGTVLGFAGGRSLKSWKETAVNDSVSLSKSQSTPTDSGNSSESGMPPHSVSCKFIETKAVRYEL